jgi:hypothetical protein
MDFRSLSEAKLSPNPIDRALPFAEDDRARIIEEFAFDPELMTDFWTKKQYQIACIMSVTSACYLCPVVAPVAIYARANARTKARAQYLAVTEHEILYTQTKTTNCCRFACCDSGTVRKSIPIDRIQDVVLREPAGGCCPKNVLYTVNIETAGQTGGEGAPELSIHGLRNAARFVEVVKKLKRAQMSDGANISSSSVCAVEPGAVTSAPLHSHQLQSHMREEISLLKSIEASMKEHTRVLTDLGSGGAIVRRAEPEKKRLV